MAKAFGYDWSKPFNTSAAGDMKGDWSRVPPPPGRMKTFFDEYMLDPFKIAEGSITAAKINPDSHFFIGGEGLLIKDHSDNTILSTSTNGDFTVSAPVNSKVITKIIDRDGVRLVDQDGNDCDEYGRPVYKAAQDLRSDTPESINPDAW